MDAWWYSASHHWRCVLWCKGCLLSYMCSSLLSGIFPPRKHWSATERGFFISPTEGFIFLHIPLLIAPAGWRVLLILEAHWGELCCYRIRNPLETNVSPSAVIVLPLYLVTPAAAVNAAHHRLHLLVNGFIVPSPLDEVRTGRPSPSVLFQMIKCSEASLILPLMNPDLIISCGFKTRICKQSYS